MEFEADIRCGEFLLQFIDGSDSEETIVDGEVSHHGHLDLAGIDIFQRREPVPAHDRVGFGYIHGG